MSVALSICAAFVAGWLLGRSPADRLDARRFRALCATGYDYKRDADNMLNEEDE